jgi:5-methylcytosine-specific restriction endonuclease McrA
MKACLICLQKKDLDSFYKKKDSIDGLHSYCKKCHLSKNKGYLAKYRKTEKGKLYSKQYYFVYNKTEKHRKYVRNYMKEYRKTEKFKQTAKYFDELRRSNPEYRVSSNISRGVRKSLYNMKNGRSWEKIVGYNIKELVKHLESQFDEKMTWENYGKYWHIDHIIPRSYFKNMHLNEEELKRCWALENLQPLEAIENIKKSNKLNYESKSKQRI